MVISKSSAVLSSYNMYTGIGSTYKEMKRIVYYLKYIVYNVQGNGKHLSNSLTMPLTYATYVCSL